MEFFLYEKNLLKIAKNDKQTWTKQKMTNASSVKI